MVFQAHLHNAVFFIVNTMTMSEFTFTGQPAAEQGVQPARMLKNLKQSTFDHWREPMALPVTVSEVTANDPDRGIPAWGAGAANPPQHSTADNNDAVKNTHTLRWLGVRLLEIFGITAGVFIAIAMSAVLFIWALMEPLY
jgi:hypothetical protein